MPKIIMNNRLRTTAGRANGDRVEFSSSLYKANTELFMVDTIPHELCHYFCRNVFGNDIQHHGADWSMAMTFLGVTPKRCHNMTVKKNKTKSWGYTCFCGITHKIATVTHNKMKAGRMVRHCLKCKGQLKFVKEIT